MTADAAEEGVRTPSGGLVKHGTLLFAASMGTNLLNYAFRILMSHRLSDADYAALDALLSVFMIVIVPAWAIQTATAKYASDLNAMGRDAEIADLFLRSLWRILKVCIVGLLVFSAGSSHIANYLRITQTGSEIWPGITLSWPVIWLGIALFVGFLIPLAVGLLQGLQKFGWIGGSQAGAAIVRIVIGGILVLGLGFGLNGAVLASVATTFAALLFVSFPIRSFMRESGRKSGNSSDVRRYLQAIILFLICQSLLSFVDGIVVKRYLDPERAAVYFRAAIVGKAFLYLPTALAMVLFPKAAELYALRESSLRLLRQAIFGSLAVAFAGALVCYLFAGPLAVIVGGASRASEVADLIRYFGLAVTPIALLQLLINHDMAVHRTSALWPLMTGTIAFIGILFIFHDSPRQILMGMGGAGCVVCALCVTWTWIAERRAVHA